MHGQAENTSYKATPVTNWLDNEQPGDVDAALNQLAARLKEIEDMNLKAVELLEKIAETTARIQLQVAEHITEEVVTVDDIKDDEGA